MEFQFVNTVGIIFPENKHIMFAWPHRRNPIDGFNKSYPCFPLKTNSFQYNG